MVETVLIWVLAVVLSAAGLAGVVLPVLPGPILLFAGLVAAAWAENFAHVGARTLTVLGLIALLAHLVDFLAGSFGAKRYGASRNSVIGAALGAVVGIFFGLVGVLLGPFVGAVLGELLSRRNLAAAGVAGFGATIGLVLGTAAKLALGFTMIGIFLVVRIL